MPIYSYLLNLIMFSQAQLLFCSWSVVVSDNNNIPASLMENAFFFSVSDHRLSGMSIIDKTKIAHHKHLGAVINQHLWRGPTVT